jgi:riboflavin biosynthesis pyrimidine reductase
MPCRNPASCPWHWSTKDGPSDLRQEPVTRASRGSPPLGSNASLVGADLGAAVTEIESRVSGEIEVAGPELAHQLGLLGLIDEYRIYLHPVAIGSGRPCFAGDGAHVACGLPPARPDASDGLR